MSLFVGLTSAFKTRVFPFGQDAFSPRFGSSRGVFLGCQAALDAAERLRQAAIGSASKALHTPPADLETDGHGVHWRGEPARQATWAELARRAGGLLTGVGEGHAPRGRLFDSATGNQVGPVDHMDASHGCDLAVDPATGEVRILRYVACHDVGRVLNPHSLRGQLIGGVAMGVGQALFERLHVVNGKVVTSGLHEYLVPTCLDVPADIDIVVLESEGGLGPRGAKGVGESAAVAAPAAVANALYDAIGAQVTSIPATPEYIVTLIDR
jgi:CO/xanthine dehydrogenase Mo-binding subunit